MPRSSFYFDPEALGSAVFLGPTEARVMELVWRHKRLTVKSALRYLGHDRDLAYTTVMTVLNRLSEKGVLKREKKGRVFEYTPSTDRETFLESRIAAVTTCLTRNFGRPNR